MPNDNLKFADEFASDYDNSVIQNGWKGPETLFPLVKNLLKSNSQILDLGIGTGESSKRFQQAGHKITGLDGSRNMLFECKKKKIGNELVLHNIEETPFPINNSQFDVIISNGVFHLVYPLHPVISETQRMLNSGGLFVFTFENTDDTSESLEIEPGTWKRKTESGVLTYKYSEKHISELLLCNNFEIIIRDRFLAYTNKQQKQRIFFTLFVAKLK